VSNLPRCPLRLAIAASGSRHASAAIARGVGEARAPVHGVERSNAAAVSSPFEAPGAHHDTSGTTAETATTGASILRGGIWNMAGRLLPQAYTIGTSVVAGRILGASGLGRLSFIAFVEATLVVACSLGLPLALMRYIGETLGRGSTGEIRLLVRWGWRIELVGAAVGFAAMAAAGALGATPRAAWVFAGLACALIILHNIPSAVLIGAQRWGEATIVGLTTGTGALVVKVVVLVEGHGIVSLFLIDAVVAFLNIVGTGYLARRAQSRLTGPGDPAGEGVRRMLRFAAIQSIGVIVTYVVWRRTELFFLDRYSSSAQIALYSVPFSAVSALLLVPVAISSTITPAIATFAGAGATDRIRSGYGRTMRLIVAITLPVTAISMSVGPSLLVLAYGSEFEGIRPILLILLAAFPAVPLLYTATALLVGVERQVLTIVAGTVAALLNIGLDFILIPRFDAIGAAFANSTAQVIGSIPAVIYAGRIVGGTDWRPRAVIRTAAASLLAAGAAVALILATRPVIGVPAATIAFFLVFVAAAGRIRILDREDASWLEATVGDRFGGVVAGFCRYASARA
jgi:O-antigen/teichoic acid export membrane protein